MESEKARKVIMTLQDSRGVMDKFIKSYLE